VNIGPDESGLKTTVFRLSRLDAFPCCAPACGQVLTSEGCSSDHKPGTRALRLTVLDREAARFGCPVCGSPETATLAGLLHWKWTGKKEVLQDLQKAWLPGKRVTPEKKRIIKFFSHFQREIPPFTPITSKPTPPTPPRTLKGARTPNPHPYPPDAGGKGVRPGGAAGKGRGATRMQVTTGAELRSPD
jgi:hypothetical protein